MTLIGHRNCPWICRIIQQDWATLNWTKLLVCSKKLGERWWQGWKATQMQQSHLPGQQNRSQHRLGQNPRMNMDELDELGTQVKTSRLYHSRFEEFLFIILISLTDPQDRNSKEVRSFFHLCQDRNSRPEIMVFLEDLQFGTSLVTYQSDLNWAITWPQSLPTESWDVLGAPTVPP